jgi:hypothetical protein
MPAKPSAAEDALRATEPWRSARRKAEQTGGGWGSGSIVMPNSSKYSAPAWMGRARAA